MKAHGEVPLNSTVSRVSTGAIEYAKVAVVPNLSQAISELKDAGFWIVSTDGSADKLINEVDYRCPICLVVGSEGFGISRLVLKNSDFVVNNTFWVGVYPGMTDAMIDYMAQVIKEAVGK